MLMSGTLRARGPMDTTGTLHVSFLCLKSIREEDKVWWELQWTSSKGGVFYLHIFQNNNNIENTSESASSAPNCSVSPLMWAFFGLSRDKNRRTSGLKREIPHTSEIFNVYGSCMIFKNYKQISVK